jgi:hypothetical protein
MDHDAFIESIAQSTYSVNFFTLSIDMVATHRYSINGQLKHSAVDAVRKV